MPKRIKLKISDNSAIIINKLTRLHNQPTTALIEKLLIQEAKQYGLIETREVNQNG